MENQNMKPPPTRRALRIMEFKNEIGDLGRKYEIHYLKREIWVTHTEMRWHTILGWRVYSRYWFFELESIEDVWRDSLEIAKGIRKGICKERVKVFYVEQFP